jgi:nucleotide-binding universal stress UspA family protein
MMLEQGPILVALDGSELAEKALPYASALADALRTHLALVSVWDGTDSDLASVLPTVALEMQQSADAHYTEYLNGIRARLAQPEIRTIVRTGDPSREIIKAADETGARMLVIATHGRSGIGRWFYGSTAGNLLRSSHLPILAVGPHSLERSDTVAIKHLMVPLDGSPLSEAALPVAGKLANALGAAVSLVRVVRWAVQSYPYSLPDAYIPQVDDELEAGAKTYLRRQEEALKSVANVDAFVVRGSIADGLLDVVEKKSVDLVVMTTHARSGLARAALGSTADRMLQGQAPILLVPPEAVATK